MRNGEYICLNNKSYHDVCNINTRRITCEAFHEFKEGLKKIVKLTN